MGRLLRYQHNKLFSWLLKSPSISTARHNRDFSYIMAYWRCNRYWKQCWQRHCVSICPPRSRRLPERIALLSLLAVPAPLSRHTIIDQVELQPSRLSLPFKFRRLSSHLGNNVKRMIDFDFLDPFGRPLP